MYGGNCFKAAMAVSGCLLALLLAPRTARAQEASQPTESASIPDISLPSPEEAEDAEYAADLAALTNIKQGNRRNSVRDLGEVLRHIDREWPRLLQSYVNPLVRGLVTSPSRNGLMLGTTLLRDNRKMTTLGAAFSTSEGRLNLTMRF